MSLSKGGGPIRPLGATCRWHALGHISFHLILFFLRFFSSLEDRDTLSAAAPDSRPTTRRETEGLSAERGRRRHTAARKPSGTIKYLWGTLSINHEARIIDPTTCLPARFYGRASLGAASFAKSHKGTPPLKRSRVLQTWRVKLEVVRTVLGLLSTLSESIQAERPFLQGFNGSGCPRAASVSIINPRC